MCSHFDSNQVYKLEVCAYISALEAETLKLKMLQVEGLTGQTRLSRRTEQKGS